VAADAGEREIRAAFHRLAIHYHPDKVRHLGAEFERVAVEKFVILKEAYETLLARKRR
jgi:DnaJ like chaperone protein